MNEEKSRKRELKMVLVRRALRQITLMKDEKLKKSDNFG
jgi:hypothetical protein